MAQSLLIKLVGDALKWGVGAMKRRRSHASFLEELKGVVRSLRKMKPGEVHVISINASYGHYQIVIGPENHSNKGGHTRPIEINGEIHHLFVSPHAVRAQPSKEQMTHNLRDTVIMRDLRVHIIDPAGDGEHIAHDKMSADELSAREYINLAGNIGEKIIHDAPHSHYVTMAAYKIIQEDIIKSFKEDREETTM